MNLAKKFFGFYFRYFRMLKLNKNSRIVAAGYHAG